MIFIEMKARNNMIITKEIPTTKTIHRIYCDGCGRFITQSTEYDDGYFSNPAEFSCIILSYKFEKDLCEDCKDKFYNKLGDVLLKIGFKK